LAPGGEWLTLRKIRAGINTLEKRAEKTYTFPMWLCADEREKCPEDQLSQYLTNVRDVHVIPLPSRHFG
jgi:hypothetical protein